MWKGLRNLEGSICCKGKKLIYFKVDRGWLEDMRVYETDLDILPFDFRYGFNQDSLFSFWENRVTPTNKTRYWRESQEIRYTLL